MDNFRCSWSSKDARFLVGTTDWVEPYDYPWGEFYSPQNSALIELCSNMPDWVLVGEIIDGVVFAHDLVDPGGSPFGPDTEAIVLNYGIPFKKVSETNVEILDGSGGRDDIDEPQTPNVVGSEDGVGKVSSFNQEKSVPTWGGSDSGSERFEEDGV